MRIYKKDFTGFKFVEKTVFKSRLGYNPPYDAPLIVYRDLGKYDFMDIGGKFHFKNEIEYVELLSTYQKIMWYLKNLLR